MADLTDHDVRAALRTHQDGGPISALFETGEIGENTFAALDRRVQEVEDQGDQEAADRLGDILTYAVEAGERPPMSNWPIR
ncbi:hypothetical protein ACFCWB_33245 [Streptomyces bacillaris]|uniref:hypothetical protein n=1 Tax=Streptomyces bacillaris TaxID=68179 RepID=UPI0035E2FCDC